VSVVTAGKVQLVIVPNLFYLGDREITEVDAGMVSDLFPESLGDCEREDVAAFYEGVGVPRHEWDSKLCDGGTLGFIVRPEGVGALGASIWAAIQTEAAVMAMWASISTAVGTLIATFLVGRVAMALLMPKDQEQVERGSTKSSVYSFSGVSNTRNEGLPLPLIFGEIRFGGTLINEYLRSGGIPEVSTLYQQISLGEGPIHSVSGIATDTPGAQPIGTEFGTIPASLQVDGNSAENFDDMFMWVRLGTNEQAVVPGFEATRVFISANLGLTALETTGTGNGGPTSGPDGAYIPGSWDDTTNDHVWTAHGVALDMGLTEIDSVILRLYFNRGLFEQNNTTGNLESSNYAFQVRYRELTSAGIPITTGGHTSDGWVRLPPVGPISTKSPQPFTLEVPTEFFDPQTWAPPVRGRCLKGEARATALESESGYTLFFWFKLPLGAIADASLSSITDLQVHSDGSLSIPDYSGFAPFNNGDRLHSAPGVVVAGVWNHITVSAWRWTDNTNGPLDVFLNAGSVIHISDQPGVQTPAWDTTVSHSIGDLAASPNTLFDQFTIYDEPLGAVAATIEFNGGLGREEHFPDGWGSQGDSRIFSAVTFNDTGGAQSPITNPRFTAWAPHSTSTSGSSTGVVPDSSVTPTNTHKRSRYRIEVLRTNVDSTSTRVSDDVTLAAALAVTNVELTYPNTPILALQVGATEQLNGSAPTTTSVVKGLLVPVWDGSSTTTPAISLEWSSNPAWIALGLLTNGRWGMGQTYLVQNCVSPSLIEWANYCDETVYSGSAQFNYDTPTGISEDVLFTTDPSDPDDRGVITFNIHKSSTGSALPLEWVVGRKLRAHGFPIPNVTDINQGALNSGTAGGYEIFGIQGATLGFDDYWLIKCYWDRLDEADPWTAGTYLSAAATIPTTATIELGESRHEFNGVFDQEQGAWDSVLEVCQVGRAIPIREGSKVRFKFQHPRTPAGLVTSANIVGGSFSVGYSNPRMKPNAVDITILDRAQQYNLVPITVLDPSIENVLNLSEVRKVSRNYLGITSAAQAERQARFELNINRLIQRGGSFTLGPSGLPFEAGDLVRLGADIMPRGDGGRALRASNPSTGYKIEMIAAPLDFTAWTASNVTVTANTVANPYGTATDADKVQDSGSSHGYVEATGTVSGSDLNAEWLSFGVYIKPGVISSNKSLVALILDGGTASYFCDWTTETIYASQFATLPEDMRSAHIQKLGTSGWYFVQVAGFHETKTSAAAAPIVRVFPASNTSGAGAATGIVELYNGRMSYGQWAAPGGPNISGRVVMIDRDITLADGAHKVYGRDFVDNAADGPLDSTLCPAGSYTTGDILITSSTMGTALQEESSWMVVKSGDELVVEIMTSTLMQNFTRECEWIEYQADIYNDTAEPTSTSGLLGLGSSGDGPRPGLDLAVNEDSPPGDTAILGAMDVLVRQAPGQYVTTIFIGLDYAQPTKRLISRTEIFWRVVGQNATDWTLAGGATGLDTNAIIQIPNAQPGQTIELTANSITQRGRRRKPGSSLRVQVPIRGLTAPPETPTDLTRKLSQRQAVYGYTVTGDDLLAVEVRRGGGWILGQLVTREAASQRAGTRSSEPTSNWAGSTTDAPTLLYAAQNAAGAYGVPATTTWSPTPDADSLPSDATAPDQAWESWESGGNGWESAVPAPGEPFIGPECEQATDGSLGYTAASTSVAWETVYTTQRDSGAALTLEQDRQPRAAFLEAWVDAEAVNHTTWDAATWEISDLLEDRWTWEGPRYTTPGETANPELVIEVRINIDGTTAGWGAWQEYKPGIYRIVDAQFRLRARRHDTGQNIIVSKLHTRITPPRLSLEETTPAQSLLHGETY